MHEEDACNVYYGSDRSSGKQQSIEWFHTDLSMLKLIWLKDSLISQRTRPSSIETNQMLINALGFPDLLEDGKNVRQCHENDKIRSQPLEKLLAILEKETDDCRADLTELHSLDSVILKKKIAKLRAENPNALNCNGLSKNYDKCALFDHVQNLVDNQEQQAKILKRTTDQALDIPSKFSSNLIDLDALKNVFNEFSITLKKYAKESEVDRKEHWENEEENQMVSMRANLSGYFAGDAVVSADAKAICQKLIAHTDCNLKTILRTKENVQEINVMIQAILTDIGNVVDAIHSPLNGLNDTAQQYLTEKCTR